MVFDFMNLKYHSIWNRLKVDDVKNFSFPFEYFEEKLHYSNCLYEFNRKSNKCHWTILADLTKIFDVLLQKL